MKNKKYFFRILTVLGIIDFKAIFDNRRNSNSFTIHQSHVFDLILNDDCL